MSENLQTLRGIIERVTFHNLENGFCVLKIKVAGNRDLVTVIGSAVTVTAGEYLECTGIWVNDRMHGLQFKATTLNLMQPTTLEGIEKYLGSGLVKGIGPNFAKRLVNAFGINIFDIIEKQPERLMELEGIGKKRKKQIIAGWNEQKKIRGIIIFLHSHGIGTSRAVKIYKAYGDNAVAKIKENPYRLALDIHGIGFKTSDELAIKLGIPRDSIMRAYAGIMHVMQEYGGQGHCGMLLEELIDASSELLAVDKNIIKQAIQQGAANKELVPETFYGQSGVMLAGYYVAEAAITKKLKNLLAGEASWQNINLDKAIPWVEGYNNIKLSKSQKQAVRLAILNKVVVITGGPGVGKTTVLNSILSIIRQEGVDIKLCAPTGRAAKRLNESTGLEAKTIHRLLEIDPNSRGFNYDNANQLKVDLLVIDETSMVDVLLMHHLLKAVPNNSGIIFVGDVDQLPSVGPGSVLADFINSNKIPKIQLTEVFRQAANSKIIINAHRINKGIIPNLEETSPDSDFYFIKTNEPEDIQSKIITLVKYRIPNRFNLDPLKDIQVLSPMNRGSLGVRSLNIELKQALNPTTDISISRYGTVYSNHDKVIQMVNNYDKEVFNGDIGFINAIDDGESCVYIKFDNREVLYDYNELDEIALAYATTIHKAQGSEYPAIVIPLATQHFTLLERNLIYTGVTRGKKLVVIVGQAKALAIAVKNMSSRTRLTKLSERIFTTVHQ